MSGWVRQSLPPKGMGGYRRTGPGAAVAGRGHRVLGLEVREMKNAYLEVTFRHDRRLAAYLYLPREPRDKSYRTERTAPGLVIDFNRRGKPIGIEITAPARLSAAALNRVLRPLGMPAVTRADLAPLRAA